MYTADIDRTHIIALQEVDGMLRNMELPITRPEQFIAELRAMHENPNRTVWDMQSHFVTRFPKNAQYLDYLQPYSYQASYVSGIHYPIFHEYNELKRSWHQAGEAALQSYIASCNHSGTYADPAIAAQSEEKAIGKLKERQKYNFLCEAMRWIDASCYYDTANQLDKDNAVKMFSKENIGWNNFTHKVNEDIKVALKTNFGYGNAAHFFLAIQYKGINLLPYSYIVKYYKAGMADIVRCTRSYVPSRESWSASFDFIADFVNKSIADPERFVESYIMEEVREMMHGLESIATNPIGFIDRIGDKKADPYVINVRHMFKDDRTKMQTYQEETPILFKVEKITGALDFLENLTEIAKEVQSVQPYIDRLFELNMTLYPEVQNAIVKITNKVDEQMAIKENLDSKIAVLSEKLKPYEEEIKNNYLEATQENPFKISDYESAHPEYNKLKQERDTLRSELSKINTRIFDLNSFIGILNRSLARLEEVNQAKQAA